jgi:hypothetical protein
MVLVDRVKKILLQPSAEWAVIDTETTDVATLYKSYIIPLAAIGPVCATIGLSVFGMPTLLGPARLSLGAALTQGVIQYALALLGVFILALIIDALAPTFGGQKNQTQAMKVAAYGSTASWVGGVFTLVPVLSILALLLALYSLYLLYAGLSPVMKSPPDKSLPYAVVVILVAIVIFVVLAAVRTAFIPTGLGMM